MIKELILFFVIYYNLFYYAYVYMAVRMKEEMYLCEEACVIELVKLWWSMIHEVCFSGQTHRDKKFKEAKGKISEEEGQ